jgi:PAS domain S-box-containing protein
MSDESKHVMSPVDESFHEAMCRTVGFALITADETLAIRCWNQRAAEMFGAGAEQMLGKPMVDSFPVHYREQIERLVEHALQAGEVSDVEFKHVMPDGRDVVLVAVVSPITAADDRRLGVSIAMRDITQRKQLSKQLASSRHMAALGHLAANIAHHFNNIFAGMIMSIEAALLGDNPRLMRKTLERLSETVGRATRITSQLLAFAESEHGQSGSVEINAALAEFVAKLRTEAQKRMMTVVAHLTPVVPRFLEAHRLIPVLEGIAQNALDAMQPGGRLTVNMAEHDGRIVISLEDTGAGIAPENLEHIFEPFYSTKTTLSGKLGAHVGLGLSAAHGLVKEMGGRITVVSKVGRGTQVTIYLPPAPAGEEAPPP